MYLKIFVSSFKAEYYFIHCDCYDFKLGQKSLSELSFFPQEPFKINFWRLAYVLIHYFGSQCF